MTWAIHLDVACLLARIEQVDREQQQPSHWLWQRIMTRDVPRLREHLPEHLIEELDRPL